jgi:hypothetical protein
LRAPERNTTEIEGSDNSRQNTKKEKRKNMHSISTVGCAVLVLFHALQKHDASCIVPRAGDGEIKMEKILDKEKTKKNIC